jgi:hypothetical protein
VFNRWFVFVPNPISNNKCNKEKKETPTIRLFHGPLPRKDRASIADEGMTEKGLFCHCKSINVVYRLQIGWERSSGIAPVVIADPTVGVG